MYDFSTLDAEQKAAACMTAAFHELLSSLRCAGKPVRVDLAFRTDGATVFCSVTEQFLRFLADGKAGRSLKDPVTREETGPATSGEIRKLFAARAEDAGAGQALLCEPRFAGAFDGETKVYAAPVGTRGVIHSEFLETLFACFVERMKETADRERMDALAAYEPQDWLDVSRRAAARFLAVKFCDSSEETRGMELYETFCLVSSASYERSPNHGRMGILTDGVPDREAFIRFSRPVDLVPENARQIRKLLEMSDSRRNILMIEDGKISGIYSPKESFNNTEIRFRGNGQWDFMIQRKKVVSFDSVCIRLGNRAFDAAVQDSIAAVFGDGCDMQRLKAIVSDARRQPHGTTIIISDHAEKESERLSRANRAISISPKTVERVRSITAIDGAVILDPWGKCCAIGAILDGEALGHGSMARGARYNSAVTYTDYCGRKKRHKVVAVIVSEDESLDIYPQA